MQLCASPLSSPLLELVALLAALVRSPPFASLAAATHAEAGRALCDAIAAARAVRRGRGDAAAGGGDGGDDDRGREAGRAAAAVAEVLSLLAEVSSAPALNLPLGDAVWLLARVTAGL